MRLHTKALASVTIGDARAPFVYLARAQ